jgi:Flp pilus assembly protein TadD
LEVAKVIPLNCTRLIDIEALPSHGEDRGSIARRCSDGAMRWAAIVLFCLLLPALCQGCAWPFSSKKGLQPEELTRLSADKGPDEWDTKKVKPDYLELARELVGRGLYEVALVQLEEASKKSSASCEIYHLMGMCHLGLARWEAAREDFNRALSLNAKYAPSHNGLGLAYDHEGMAESAWESYAKAIALNPARADFHCNLGYSKLKAGRYREAEKHFRDSLALNPAFKAARNNLALCCGLQKRYDEALALLRQNFSAAEAYNNLGVLYQMNGDRESAVRCYKEALKINNALNQARENLANCNVTATWKEPDALTEEP